ALTKASIENVIIAITVTEVPRVVRLIRSLVLGLREQPYVDAAIAAGTRTARILTRHILPPPHPSQHGRAAAGARHLYLRLRHAHRGHPVVSWRRHSAQHPEL